MTKPLAGSRSLLTAADSDQIAKAKKQTTRKMTHITDAPQQPATNKQNPPDIHAKIDSIGLVGEGEIEEGEPDPIEKGEGKGIQASADQAGERETRGES